MVRSSPLAAGLALALLADELLGDPRRWHPVAGFGRIAAALERRMYRDSRTAGTLHAMLLVAPGVIFTRWLDRRLPAPQRLLLVAVTVWSSLGGRSLRRTAARM